MSNQFINLKTLKNTILLILIICLVFIMVTTISSCIKIGSGNVISEDRSVSGFSKVLIKGSGNLYIEQGDEESITIEAEDNILPLIKTEVSGNTLTISLKSGTKITTKSMEFHLRVKNLDSISASGSANINCSGLSTENLYIKTSGSGDVDISNLIATNIDIDALGSGNYTLAGKTDNLKISSSGSSDFSAEDLDSKECTIKNTGSGNLLINVSDYLNGINSGSGNVSYVGNPTLDLTISGSGKLGYNLPNSLKLTFKATETDLIKLGEMAFDGYMTLLAGEQTPIEERIASYRLNEIALLAGDINEFCVSVTYDYTTENDSFVNSGDGAKGKGTWNHIYREIRVRNISEDTYEIVSIGTGGGAQGLMPSASNQTTLEPNESTSLPEFSEADYRKSKRCSL